jgi:serine/threonine-protein kinase
MAEPGAVFHGRYRIVRLIKDGGMGAVYEAVDERTNSPRALKLMLPSMLADPDLRRRFATEATVTGGIDTDHVVRVSDAGVDEPTDTPFLVMELLRGKELGTLLEEQGPLPPEDAVLYLQQTALALDKTHLAGIVHRDLKPENLFVTYRDDGSPCVKVLDFGIAKMAVQSAGRSTRTIGTPLFMAPEQVRGGAIGPPADLFALGHIAYALLAGEPYWNEELLAIESIYPLLSTITEGIREAPTARALRRSGVVLPAAFDGWMQRSLASRPEERFERATAQVAALAEALGVPPPPASRRSDAACAPTRPRARDVAISWESGDVPCTTGEQEAPPSSRPEDGPPASAPASPAPRGARAGRVALALAVPALIALCAGGAALALRSRSTAKATLEPAASADRSGAAPELPAGTSLSAVSPPPITPTPSVGGRPPPAARSARASDPAATGRLDIDSTPASHVLLDGRPLGRTPRIGEPVSAGRHDLAFVYSPGVSCRQSIHVSPGASAKAMDRLGAPPSPGRRCRMAGDDQR